MTAKRLKIHLTINDASWTKVYSRLRDCVRLTDVTRMGGGADFEFIELEDGENARLCCVCHQDATVARRHVDSYEDGGRVHVIPPPPDWRYFCDQHESRDC